MSALLLFQLLAATLPFAGNGNVVYDTFQSGKEGYSCYRGHTDIVFKISKDNGKSFGPLHVLYGESTNTTKVTIGNPSPVVVDGKVLMLCVRNAQQVLLLRSADAAGMVWPKVADDITASIFDASNTYMDCKPGAMAAGADLLQANMTASEAKAWCLSNATCAGFTAKTPAAAACASMETNVGGRLGSNVLQVYFKSRAGSNIDATWSSWTKPGPPGTLVATGPPGGILLHSSGRIVAEYYLMGGATGSSAGAFISDDNGRHFRKSADALPRGGEGTIALAPNGSLILNSRAPDGMRYQSTGHPPRLVAPLNAFGSNAEGSMIRMANGSDQMLFSHGGDINGTGGRWNMTIWSSIDSATTWTPTVQVEPDASIALHLAYSCMVQLNPNQVLVVWERGPMHGSCKGYPNCFPPSGEYQTLRARIVTLPTAKR
eukprot:gene17666-32989_t